MGVFWFDMRLLREGKWGSEITRHFGRAGIKIGLALRAMAVHYFDVGKAQQCSNEPKKADQTECVQTQNWRSEGHRDQNFDPQSQGVRIGNVRSVDPRLTLSGPFVIGI